MEQALGLVNGRGQSWKQQVAHTERDGLIRQAVARHFPGPLSPAAEAFAKALANYAATAWKLDREKPLGACPYRPGTLKSALFHILKLDPNPLRKSRLRDILSS
jgi:hypothetical protein